MTFEWDHNKDIKNKKNIMFHLLMLYQYLMIQMYFLYMINILH